MKKGDKIIWDSGFWFEQAIFDRVENNDKNIKDCVVIIIGMVEFNVDKCEVFENNKENYTRIYSKYKGDTL